MKKILTIIPARLDSQRLPGKPLKMIKGKSLLQHTFLAARSSVRSDYTLITSPDREILNEADRFTNLWRPSREDHQSGTSRCSEILQQLKDDADIGVVVNWQVDEPNVLGSDVDKLIENCLEKGGISTLVGPPLESPFCESCDGTGRSTCIVQADSVCSDCNGRGWNVQVVKVAMDLDHRCHWFSRAPLAGAASHIGVYAYPASLLRSLEFAEPTYLSKEEDLEQLTWIENGFPIHAVMSVNHPLAINTQNDLDTQRELLKG